MHTLYHGDCLEIMPTLQAGSIDAIITDLPYGTTACEWDSIIPLDEMWKQVKRLLKPNGVFVSTSSEPFTSALIMSNPSWFKYDWIFEKYQGSGFMNAKIQPLRNHESIPVFYNTQCTYNPQRQPSNKKDKSSMQTRPVSTNNYRTFDKAVEYKDDGFRMPTTVMKFYDKTRMATSKKDRGRHPTQKPVTLFEYLIRTYTNPGEIVLDIAMGSGTTGVAAIQTGRDFIGIEKLPVKKKDPDYFQMASVRVAQAHPPLFTETATPANTARTRQGDSSRQNSLFSAESDPAPSDGTTPAPCG